jgi:hypothetical protein
MPNPTTYKINRAEGGMQSFHKFSYPIADSDAPTPMINRQDQYGATEKASSDLGGCQTSEGPSIEQRTKLEVVGLCLGTAIAIEAACPGVVVVLNH